MKSIKKFLSDICTGKRLTLAQWMRQFINNHKMYKKDSLLPKVVMDDLLITLYAISTGEKVD